MWFGKKNGPLPTGVITTSEGLVTSYNYLGVWLDGTLSFSQHISKLQAKVKSRLGFLYVIAATPFKQWGQRRLLGGPEMCCVPNGT